MQNPFETGHIKNYLLLYASVVVIMVLFFIASTLFNDVKKIQKKTFDNNNTNFQKEKELKKIKDTETKKSSFKLMDKSY